MTGFAHFHKDHDGWGICHAPHCQKLISCSAPSKYDIASYATFIRMAHEALEPQRAWLQKLGTTFEDAVKARVEDHVSQIKCTFNEEAYEKGLAVYGGITG